MTNDERPKDYSSVYSEDSRPPVPPTRRSVTSSSPAPMSQKSVVRCLDGARSQKRVIESWVDLKDVFSKLKNVPQESHRADAMDTLKKHYSTVFTHRRRTQILDRGMKAYVQYHNEKDTFVVRVDSNTLGDVRRRVPKQGNYRYFFKQLDNTWEEVETDEVDLPFHIKNETKQIYCQIFPY